MEIEQRKWIRRQNTRKRAAVSKLIYRFITFPIIITTVLETENIILKFIQNLKDVEELKQFLKRIRRSYVTWPQGVLYWFMKGPKDNWAEYSIQKERYSYMTNWYSTKVSRQFNGERRTWIHFWQEYKLV